MISSLIVKEKASTVSSVFRQDEDLMKGSQETVHNHSNIVVEIKC